ncbi:unnamed protein product [Cuscuta campestris]|uniref:Uncharacterized protein n=2 Tax=Cuscuta sect. Cleistogrammica TaxID=1824901 RepID=A0A484M147_9ASTE|nr:hypothetical protein DM860_000471 [Cuscuta australis]VFQ82522.1 unnamed protein product [Cuscuta campestris]
MDGVGSRFGRSSSRYSSAPPSTVFDGPVRKWKKQWVSTQPATPRNSCNKAGAVIFLCRWIPLPSATPTHSNRPQMSSKRKFQYAPEASRSKLHPNKKASWNSPHTKEAVDVESTRSSV